MKDTIILELKEYEKGIIVNALNDKRNELNTVSQHFIGQLFTDATKHFT